MTNTYKNKGGKNKIKKSKKARGIKKKVEITDEEKKLFAEKKKSTPITNMSGKELQKYLTDNSIYYPSTSRVDDLKKIFENPDYTFVITETKSKIMSRLATLQYEAVKDYVNSHYEINQPKFEKIDKEKKLELWGIKNLSGKFTSAIGDEICNINKGDHIYGIREGLAKNNILGSDSKWNMIPCTQDENVSWKIVGNKNLVYDTFTEKEITEFDKKTKTNYENLQEWKNYCAKRGAKLYWINGSRINNLVTQLINIKLVELDKGLKELVKIPQDIELKPSQEDKIVLREDDI